jgi:hypothetical protein
MLPIPSINFFPQGYQDNPTDAITALAGKIDDIFSALEQETFDLLWLKNVERCPSKYLNELGYMLNAGLQKIDTDRIKRQKIYKAIQSHKIRGSWIDHAKIIIDAITGYSAVMFVASASDDWILGGDGIIELDSPWAILESGVDDPYGMNLIGEGTEIEISGNIYINCHDGIKGSTLTSDQINNIVNQIKDDIVPAYMRIYLGYIDTDDSFVVYTDGIIG